MMIIKKTSRIKFNNKFLSSISVKFIEDNKEINCKGKLSETLLKVAKDNNVSLEGTCGGSQSCSTCHVYVDKKYINKLEPIQEDEEDLLDMVDDYKVNSRLACAIKLNEHLDGIVLDVPTNSTNLLH